MKERGLFKRLGPSALFSVTVFGAFVLGGLKGNCLAGETLSWPQILQSRKSFRVVGSVLLVAAHPDDENTQLITYLARGRGYRMAYLSLTRGDGGQNLLGSEFGDERGLLRPRELLAPRRIDGGQQFFSRARDFGYS